MPKRVRHDGGGSGFQDDERGLLFSGWIPAPVRNGSFKLFNYYTIKNHSSQEFYAPCGFLYTEEVKFCSFLEGYEMNSG